MWVGEAGQPLIDHREHAVINEVGDERLQGCKHAVCVQRQRREVGVVLALAEQFVDHVERGRAGGLALEIAAGASDQVNERADDFEPVAADEIAEPCVAERLREPVAGDP